MNTASSAGARPRTRSLLLLTIPLALAALLAVLAWPPRGPASSQPAPPAPDADQRVAAMQDEINMLRRRLDHLTRQPTAPAAPAVAAAAQPPVPPTQEHVSARDKRRFEGLAAKLAAEPVDPRWAPATEHLIADTLGKPEFKGSKLMAATCRSTLCRFEVGHDDETARRRFSNTLPNRLPALPSGSMRNAEGSEPKTIVYVAREGHRIPRDDPQ